MTSNFADDILEAVGDEQIEAIVVGNDLYETASKHPFNKVVQWNDVAELLAYNYDTGFGGAECHPVYIWTPTRVLFVHEYDGSTSISSVPRHPVDANVRYDGSRGVYS